MANHGRKERVAEELGTRELFAVVRGRGQAVEATEALRELLERQPSRTALLTELVADPKSPAELRATAAIALGRDRKPSHQRALLTALASREPLVIRRAAEALGRIGDESALTALAKLSPPAGPARRSVVFARSLISYRLGLTTHRLTPPPGGATLEVRPRRSVQLEHRAPAPRALAAIMEDAEQELPAVAMSRAGARQISCDGSTFVILIARAIERAGGFADLTRASAVVGAVLEQSPVSGRFSLNEYLLSEPAGGATVRIYGVRDTGVVCHVGELRADGTGAFTVRAVNTPISPPVAIDGTYDTKQARMTFTRALALRERDPAQAPPGVPARLEFPRG